MFPNLNMCFRMLIMKKVVESIGTDTTSHTLSMHSVVFEYGRVLDSTC